MAEFTKQHGRAPGLHVVLAGSDPASAVYVRNKEKNAKEVGIAGQVHRLPESVSQAELMALVQQLNQDPAVDGFIVQLPLYPGLAAEPILDAMGKLRSVYPNVLHVERPHFRAAGEVRGNTGDHRALTDVELFEAFYSQVTGEKWNERQAQVYAAIIDDLRRREREVEP